MKIIKSKNYKKAQQQISYQEIFNDSLNRNNGDTTEAAKEVLDFVTGGTWAVWDTEKINRSIQTILKQFASSTDFSKCNICDKPKHREDMGNNNICKDCEPEELEVQRAGRKFLERGEHVNYPEFGDIGEY